MATCAQKQTWLADAEAALHTVQMGGAVTLISTGSKEIRYAAANVADLMRHVAGLRAEVAACTGIPDPCARRAIGIVPGDSGRGPIRGGGW